MEGQLRPALSQYLPPSSLFWMPTFFHQFSGMVACGRKHRAGQPRRDCRRRGGRAVPRFGAEVAGGFRRWRWVVGPTAAQVQIRSH